jgi:hypothetical protein
MGIGGHMLGDKKLRQLRQATGLNFDRAYRRGWECEGRVINPDGTCSHYRVDPLTEQYVEVDAPVHWASCPRSDHFRSMLAVALDKMETRGGVVIKSNDEYHELRVWMHDYGVGERAWISLDDIRLLAQMSRVER